jgi:hypothetical protein
MKSFYDAIKNKNQEDCSKRSDYLLHMRIIYRDSLINFINVAIVIVTIITSKRNIDLNLSGGER